MYVLSLLNVKGGVSKSVSASSIGSLLSKAGFKVLLIDLDPQANLSSLYGCQAPLPLADLLARDSVSSSELSSHIVSTPYKNTFLLPGDRSLSEVIYKLYDQAKEEDISDRLLNVVNSVHTDYDYVIIDNSPFESYLTTLALRAADLVLAPIDVDNFSYEGLILLFDKIQKMNRTSDHNISFKVFFTKVNRRTTLFKSLNGQYQTALGNVFCRTFVRIDNNVKESATVYKPLPEYAPSCNAVEDYISLIRETLPISKKDFEKMQRALKDRR